MAAVSGYNITSYQGETLDAVFSVVDEDGVAYDLTDGTAVFTYWLGQDDGVDVNGTISTSTVTVAITHAVLAALEAGEYNYQLFCKNAADKIVMVREGLWTVKRARNPHAVG